MTNPIRTLVRDYGWIHLSIGLTGNALFFVGSVLFLPKFDHLDPIPVWIFIVGSLLMLIGALGQLLVRIYETEEMTDGRPGAGRPGRRTSHGG